MQLGEKKNVNESHLLGVILPLGLPLDSPPTPKDNTFDSFPSKLKTLEAC